MKAENIPPTHFSCSICPSFEKRIHTRAELELDPRPPPPGWKWFITPRGQHSTRFLYCNRCVAELLAALTDIREY
jgi:hypothetical protein